MPWNKGAANCYSLDALAKMSGAQKSRFQRMDTPNKGVPHTEETKEKIRQSHLGVTHSVSLEARGKISAARRGKPRPPHVQRILAESSRKIAADPILAEERARKAQQGIKNRPTSIEYHFMALCTEFNLPFRYVGNGEVWIARKNPDFININGRKQVVEILGSYWHNAGETQDRIDHYARYGFECITIWDYELQNTSVVLGKLGEAA